MHIFSSADLLIPALLTDRLAGRNPSLFADHVEITPARFERLLNGAETPTLSEIDRIARAMDFPRDLFTGKAWHDLEVRSKMERSPR
jgi:hypothetical protein